MTRTTLSVAAGALLVSGGIVVAQTQDRTPDPSDSAEQRAVGGQDPDQAMEAGPRGSIFLEERARSPDQTVEDQTVEDQAVGDQTVGNQTVGDQTAEQPQQVAATREAVYQAQRELKALGYDVGPVDGLYGPKTRSAIQAFQRDQGLPESGDLTMQLLAELDRQAYDTQQAETEEE